MNFHVLTLFPDMVSGGLNTSILGRAAAGGHISLETVNIRDFTENKHKKVDDYPYGGGAVCSCRHSPFMTPIVP